jgi:prepilin-type N-terminal cleavage/methylation domain-containing protein
LSLRHPSNEANGDREHLEEIVLKADSQTMICGHPRPRAVGSVRRRLGSEEGGMTLVEMLLALVILGILIAVAVPSYLTLKDRANRAAATANIRLVIPDILAYAADNVPNGSSDPDASSSDTGYTGLTFTILSSKYDSSIQPAKYSWDNSYTPSPDDASDYCLSTFVGRWYAAKQGPNGPITTGTTMTLNTCTAS